METLLLQERRRRELPPPTPLRLQRQELIDDIELEDPLEAAAVPASPGAFYVFKDDELSQWYFAARYRRREAAPRQRTSDRRFEEHRLLLEPLMVKVTELGRLPFPDELSESQPLIGTFGSLKRAFALIRRVTGAEEWETLRQERIDDLSVYLALARFRKRPPISSLPLDLQRDIREFFGTYTRACETADACLFQAGVSTAIDDACQRSPVGRLSSNALFVHKSAVTALEPVLRIYEGCARAYLGEIDDANVVKLHRFSGKVSYLACPDFDAVPHPAMQRMVILSLRSRELDCRDHSGKEDPLVLDRKELPVGPDYPGHEKFTRFTEQEESHGLLDGLTDLWTQRQWELQFEQAGLQLRGYRLLWKPGHKRRRRPEVGHVSNVAGTLETCFSGNATDLAMADEVPAPAAENEHSSPERDGPDSAKRLILPQRSRQFGVGKKIGGAVYVHRQYEDRLGPSVVWAKRWLPKDFAYDVVKYNWRTQAVSFICCPGFDVEPEPNVEGVVIIHPDGTVRRQAIPPDPPIYHHKWLFVDDDYTGFDVQESQRRSAAWLALANVDKSRIGRRSYWQAHVVPLLVGCPCRHLPVTMR